MTDKELADIVCRCLISIVAALRKKYDLPNHQNVTIEIRDNMSGAIYQESTLTQPLSPSSPSPLS